MKTQLAYHGSNTEFDRFDLSKFERGDYGYGIYFTRDKSYAANYGNVKQYQIPDDEYLLDIDISIDYQSEYVQQVLDNVLEDVYRSKDLEGYNKLADVCFRDYCNTGWNIYETLWDICGSAKQTSAYLDKMGIKGIDASFKHNCIVIFNPDNTAQINAVTEEAAMYKSNKNTFDEFYNYVIKNPKCKKCYFEMSSPYKLRIPSDTILHDYKKHSTSLEQWKDCIYNMENIINASKSRKTLASNKNAVYIIHIQGKAHYGLSLQINADYNQIMTLFVDSPNKIENWVKTSPAGGLSDNPIASLGQSPESVVQPSQNSNNIITYIKQKVKPSMTEDLKDKIYYHGSNYRFTKFDKSKIKENKLGLCFNFSDDISMAYQYGDNILKVSLDLNNPLTLDKWDDIFPYEYYNMFYKKFCNTEEDYVKEKYEKHPETIGDMFNVYKMEPEFIEILQAMGYDGLAFPEQNHYGVFEPEQIILLNNVNETLIKIYKEEYDMNLEEMNKTLEEAYNGNWDSLVKDVAEDLYTVSDSFIIGALRDMGEITEEDDEETIEDVVEEVRSQALDLVDEEILNMEDAIPCVILVEDIGNCFAFVKLIEKNTELKTQEEVENAYQDKELESPTLQYILAYLEDGNFYNENGESLDLEDINLDESVEIKEEVAGYETVAEIVQNDKGFNVAEKDEVMLNKDEPSLKTLLQKLAQYM